ncbi:MAG: hypothetical protein ACE10E_09205 [Acidiferrobacterales bacterium]
MQRNANKGSAKHRQPRATEVTLIAVGLRAAGVLSRIARLRRVSDYVALHDRDAGMHVRAYEQVDRFLRGSARAGSG